MMNRIYYIVLFAMVLNSSCVRGQDGNPDCVFDPSSINDEFLQNRDDIQSYKWYNDTGEATILMETGEYVYIKKWACMSYGMEAKKVIVTPLIVEDGTNYWLQILGEFGQQFLAEADYNDFKKSITEEDWIDGNSLKNGSKFDLLITHPSYSEFYVSIEKYQQVVVLTYSYYMN